MSRNPETRSVQDGEELILTLPRQTQGLALNEVAARAWQLMDGHATLRDIARRIQGEYHVDLQTSLHEVRTFASRIRRGWYALPRDAWLFAHTHESDPFEGTRDEGIIEERTPAGLIVHRAEGA